jgi:oligopeptide/dipeptide ABC transporter ATP-binding protein
LEDKEKKILEVKNLKKYFPVRAGVFRRTVGYLKAVNNISFYIQEKEVLGLVGESGCGKSTTGKCLIRLIEPTAGDIIFKGKNILSLNKKNLKQVRKDIQIIFQDPYSSLNPRMEIADIIGEPLDIHRICKNKKERNDRVRELLESVGLSADHMKYYAHEFSGGQRQRIGIARALAVNPKLIIADEPVSALDVSTQAQVINLMQDLQRDFGLTYLFIAHDLSLVKHISDRIAVMYLGKIVEVAKKKTFFSNPLHYYTLSLISAIPIPDPNYRKKRIILKGDIPSSVNIPSGCPFHTRCPKAIDICRKREPILKDYNGNGHYVACHLV